MRMSTVKFLGVNVDEQLSWKDHISNICKKSQNISVLFKVTDLLSSYYLHTLHCPLNLPYMTYACEIWGNNPDCKAQKDVACRKELFD